MFGFKTNIKVCWVHFYFYGCNRLSLLLKKNNPHCGIFLSGTLLTKDIKVAPSSPRTMKMHQLVKNMEINLKAVQPFEQPLYFFSAAFLTHHIHQAFKNLALCVLPVLSLGVSYYKANNLFIYSIFIIMWKYIKTCINTIIWSLSILLPCSIVFSLFIFTYVTEESEQKNLTNKPSYIFRHLFLFQLSEWSSVMEYYLFLLISF